MAVRVLLVDDQALVRAGFRMILDAEGDIEIVAEATDGLEALALVDRYTVDVALMDIRMPNLDGIEATRRVIADGGDDPTRVLMLTTFDLNEYVYEALRAGASGFLLKDAPPERLVEAIHVVANGDSLLAPAVTRRVIEEYVRRPLRPDGVPVALGELTARELDVLRLIARGRSNAEIAGELVLGETTVKTHVARILQKLDLRDRVQAVVFAYEVGLVQAGASGADATAAGP